MYFSCFHVLWQDLKNAIRRRIPIMAENFENVIYHHDNAPPNTSSSTRLELEVLEF